MRTEASAEVQVPVAPETAFEIFTTELDLWWVRGPINHYDSSRLAELRMEPGVGGRVLEIYDEQAGDIAVRERVTVWDPGARLVLEGDETGVEINFEAFDSGTRVQVRQYLLPTGDPERAGFGWTNMLHTYDAWIQRRDTAPRTPRELDRLGIALYYKDPGAAARWLRDVFQLGDWDVDHAPKPGEQPNWIEFHVGNGLIVLFARDDQQASSSHDQPAEVWVNVDDLEAHYRHAEQSGATIISEIVRHGSTQYQAQDLEGRRWTFIQARPTMRLGPGPVDELAAAASDGSRERVSVLVAKVDPEQAGLLLARFAQDGDAAAITVLLRAGVDVDTFDDAGATALHHAAGAGRTDCVQALIDGGADLDLRDHLNGSSPVLWARELGHPEVINLLLSRGARLNAADASKLGLTQVLAGFLDDVPESLDRSVGWPTPLTAAIANGQLEAVRLLLERGADPSASAGDGSSPTDCLRWVGSEADRQRIEALLSSYADITVRSR